MMGCSVALVRLRSIGSVRARSARQGGRSNAWGASGLVEGLLDQASVTIREIDHMGDTEHGTEQKAATAARIYDFVLGGIHNFRPTGRRRGRP
jgi:hypothetical protein